MTVHVVDASVIGALLIPDEEDRLLPGLTQILEAGDALVPSHWWLEVANIAAMAQRRGRITRDYADAALGLLGAYSITEDSETGTRAWRDTRLLAERRRLTIYDAAYLELAIRRMAPLASHDGALLAAARAEGVRVVTN